MNFFRGKAKDRQGQRLGPITSSCQLTNTIHSLSQSQTSKNKTGCTQLCPLPHQLRHQPQDNASSSTSLIDNTTHHLNGVQISLSPLSVLRESDKIVSGMKKLYRKGTVHPSPPNKLDQLNFLPAAILTLAAALSPEEKEALAYLISCSNTSGNSFSNHHQHNRRGSSSSSAFSSSSSFARSNTTGNSGGDHPPSFKCDCFRCYMSYWARWDSSPNRELIHEIIEAFEDWLVQSSKSSKSSRKDRKKKGIHSNRSSELKRSETSQKNELGESDSVIESSSSGGGDDGGGGCGSGGGGDEGVGEEDGSVRRLMNFIGERIWGVWGSSI